MIKYVYKRKSNNAGNGSTVLQSLGNKRRKSQRSQDKRQRVRETDRHAERDRDRERGRKIENLFLRVFFLTFIKQISQIR